MKAISLISTGVLVLIAHLALGSPDEENSLEILKALKNRTYAKNRRVKIACEVKSATSYHWYKDGKSLRRNSNRMFRARRRKLIITRFSKADEGIYECEGRNGNGNYGRTKAKLTLQERQVEPSEVVSERDQTQDRNLKDIKLYHPCEPLIEETTDHTCIPFYEPKCPNVTTFAPKAENVNVRIKINSKFKPYYGVYLNITWDVPKQGSGDIWGWQIRIFHISDLKMHDRRKRQECIQYNRRYVEEATVIEVQSTYKYKVEVQGVPYFVEPSGLTKTVVRKIIEVPGICEMISDKDTCCRSQVNVSFGLGKHNATTLFWTTHYPENITIDLFLVRWISHPDDRCHVNEILLDSTESSYKFRNLTSKCGNYTIMFSVMFTKATSDRVRCPHSPIQTLFFQPPVPGKVSGPSTGSPTSKRLETISTVALTLAAIFGGIIIAALVYVRKRCKKRKEESGGCGLSMIPKDNMKVFILNPNHCDLCTEVVQALGSLLIKTGHIQCEIDMFVPPQEKCQGPARWTHDKILSSDYVIIPWMCEINPPKQDNTVKDMNTLIFLSSLDIISGELVRNRYKQGKFIPVCLDHCSLEILPANQVLLQTYNIPSKIDDLVIELLGITRRRPDTRWPIVEFDDEDYKTAKRNLEQAVDKIKKNHHPRW